MRQTLPLRYKAKGIRRQKATVDNFGYGSNWELFIYIEKKGKTEVRS